MKKLVFLVAAMVVLVGSKVCNIRALAACNNGICKSEYVTLEEYNMFIDTLRAIACNNENGDYEYYDTGIICGSSEEGNAVAKTLEKLFMGDINKVSVIYNTGWDYAVIEERDVNSCKYTYTLNGRNAGNKGHIYVAFQRDADAPELLRQHDAAEAIVDSVVAAAPDEFNAKIKFFNDWIANNNSYDWAGYNSGINEKHSVYNTVCEGSSVCEGYARTFFNLCFKSGISSAYIPCNVTKADGTVAGHAMNGVLVDGIWKKVDTCWNDTDLGVIYTYFMIDFSQDWQEDINRPYMIIS